MNRKLLSYIFEVWLILLVISGAAFADNAVDSNVLSPAINLDNPAIMASMQSPKQPLAESLKTITLEIDNPYEALGTIVWSLKVDGENLVIRELVIDSDEGIEVHNSLMRVLADGTEKFLGQAWYRFKSGNARLGRDASRLDLPAFKTNEEGNGYGTIIFAAVLESAKKFGVDYFSIQIALTSIYERFGFSEIEYGMLDELYMIITPKTPNAFDTAVELLKNRGINSIIISENKSSPAMIIEQSI